MEGDVTKNYLVLDVLPSFIAAGQLVKIYMQAIGVQCGDTRELSPIYDTSLVFDFSEALIIQRN